VTTDPEPEPDDTTKDHDHPTLLSTADYIAGSVNGTINPDEWGEI
jgi:hypothetical protein